MSLTAPCPRRPRDVAEETVDDALHGAPDSDDVEEVVGGASGGSSDGGDAADGALGCSSDGARDCSSGASRGVAEETVGDASHGAPSDDDVGEFAGDASDGASNGA